MSTERDQKSSTGVTKLSDDQSKKLDFFIDTPLRSADKLMKSLYTDDKFYETTTYAWVRPEDAKKLFLFGVCKEIMKVCIELMQNKEFLQGAPGNQNKDTVEKIVYGATIDGQNHHLRKMVELLSLMILFCNKTKRDEEYRIYLSAENLNIVLSQQAEFKTFYEGETVLNTQHSIDDFVKRINDDLKLLEQDNVWFLDQKRFHGQKPPVLISKRSMYLEALLVATDDERLALGVSYHKTYSRLSLSTHPLLGSHDYGDKENDHRTVNGNIEFISIVCMHIMHKAYMLAGKQDSEGIDRVLGLNFEKSDAAKILSKMRKEFDNGDIILTAWTDLAEIIGSKKSKYGYKAYRVRYISRAPIAEYPEDWLEAQHILIRLLPKSEVRAFYEKASKSVEEDELKEIMVEVLKQPDEELLESAKKTFLDLHKAGILIPMLIKSGHLKPKIEE